MSRSPWWGQSRWPHQAVAQRLRAGTIAVLAPFLLTALTVPGCSEARETTVGGRTITIASAEFQDMIHQAERRYRIEGRSFPVRGSKEFSSIARGAISDLIDRRELADQAARLGISVGNRDIDTRIAAIQSASFDGSTQRFADQRVVAGMTENDMHDAIRAELIRSRVFQKVTSGVSVSDDEVGNYYQRHIDSYRVPKRREVRQILVPTRSLARRVRGDLIRHADFCRLAKRYSQDRGSATRCGRLLVRTHEMVAAFDEAAFSLPAHELSRPIAVPYGFYLLEPVAAVRPASFVRLRQAKESIEELLLQTRRADMMAQWIRQMQRLYLGKIVYPDGYRSSP
jgi:parvulin-like peptidyl-prolyl isomerase